MSRSALLVIDVQNIYTDPDCSLYSEGADVTVANINKLITQFQKMRHPIIYVQHMHKNDASDLGRMFDFAGETEWFDFKEGSHEVDFCPELIVDAGPKIVRKSRYSSFYQTDLEKYLNQQSVDHLVICGFMTNFCCESAARDAHDRDFFVDFILDATGTPGVEGFDQEQTRTAVAAFLSAGFATVYTTDEYLS